MCVSVYLSVLLSVSIFVSILGYNFWSNLHRKFFFWFWCKSWRFLHKNMFMDTHIHTNNLHAQFKKKGNFLLFGIAIVFQIVDLIFGRLIQISPNISQDMLGLVVLLVQMYPRIFRDIYELKAEHIIQSNTYNSAIGYILSTSLNTASMYLRFWTEV